MAGKRAKAPKKGLYKKSPHLPKGEVISDISNKKSWIIGESVGVGGFGQIYSACCNEGPSKGKYDYVVKVEPHENGPLFVEKNFYIRHANEKDIKEFMKSNSLKSIGMPTSYGQGTHQYNGEKCRFLVLERYGSNIWDLFEKCKRSFPPATVFLLGVQMLDVLKYIHKRGFAHADIKGGNILMGRKTGSENQAYLVDFGLVTRLPEKEYKKDPKSAHNGTLEYTSRDAHQGGPTMRGDLEILAYNMLQWLTGTLPWLKSDEEQQKQPYKPATVMKMKEDFMDDVRNRIKKEYPYVPEAMIKFFEYIKTLKEIDTPDYAKCQKIFLDYLKSIGKNKSSKLDFKHDAVSNNDTESKDESKVEVKKRGRKPKSNIKNVEISENDEPDEITNTVAKVKVARKVVKRKSTEPLRVAKLKRLKTSSVTPPAKRNHANIATQTSVEKSRQVSFDSPISEVIGAKNVNASPDMFEGSPEIEVKKKTKRKLLSSEEVTVQRVLKKKLNRVGKSWKDAPTIVNGKSPTK